MATSHLPLLLLLSLFAAAASARPCKTIFYFSATTTTTYYPRNPLSGNPDPNSYQTPRYLTLIFTTNRNPIADSRPSLNLDSKPSIENGNHQTPSGGFPFNFYSSVSSSIRDRTKDIMSVVGALLFGVGCGALTAAIMYFLWALFSPSRFDFIDSSSSDDDDDDDDVTAYKKKLAYVAIPTKYEYDLEEEDLKKEVV